MAASSSKRLPSGRQPYDPLNGFRIGGLAGGLAGALITATLSVSTIWVIVLGAVVGAAAGYWSQKKDGPAGS